MPKIPTAEAFGQQPVPGDTGFIAAPSMPQTSGTDALASALSVAGERFQRIQDQNDKIAAEHAYNKLIEKQQDLTVGQDGFVHKQGADALNQPLMKDYTGLLQKSKDEISSTLQNDQQRQMFNERADIAGLQFRQDILNHVVKEQDAFATQTFKNTIQLEKDNAANRYRDPNAIKMSMMRIENAVNSEAHRNGWSDETRTSVLTQNTSTAYRGVIERMLSNGMDQNARDYYNQLKNSIPIANGGEIGQFGKGNIDLYARPKVQNQDGSISTVRSMSFHDDTTGKEVLVPTVSVDGRIMSDKEAIDNYYKTGQYLGKFNSVSEADKYAEKLHEQQANLYIKGKTKSPFTAKDTIAIEQALHVGTVKGDSQRKADELVSKHQDDLKSALDEARTIKDPELRDAVVSRVKGHIADNENAIKLNHDEAFTHAYQVVEQTGSTANLEPKYQVLLSRTDMNYLDLRANELKNNTIPQQNPKVWEDFNYTSRDYKALAGMSDSEFYGKYWVNFDDAHRKRAVSLREAAIAAEANDPNAQTKLEDHVTFETRMFDTLHRLNIIPYGKTETDVKDLSDEDRTMIGNFRQEADAQIREYQVAHGLKYVDGDTKQKIMDKLALQKYLKVSIARPFPMWDQSGVPAYQLTPEQQKLAYIPMTQISPISQEKIFNFAKSEGIIPRTMPMSTFLDNYQKRVERAKFADINGASPNQIIQILRGM